MPLSTWGLAVESRRSGGSPSAAGTGASGDERSSGSTDQLRPITALFADIVGSTALGEFLAMDEVKALVGECISRICEVIERHGGAVGAYMGDGVAAFFGLETAHEHDQVHAAIAALELRRVVADYAREAKSAWGVDNLNVRIGINSGRVAIGSVGGNQPQVLALGDTVNVAARLQAIADPGSIVIGPLVATALRGQFKMEKLGPVELKGRAKTVEANVLVAEASSHDQSFQPIVGRDVDMARLEGLLADLSSGRGRVVFVLGEAGIGKTRLIEEMRRRTPSNILWLSARASQRETRLPYAPFVDALRTWLGLGIGEPDIAVRVRLQARLRDLGGDGADELVAPLARLLGVRPNSKADRRLDGLPLDVLRSNLHRSYQRWLLELARKVPVVLAIDNFGQVDDATVQLGEEILAITDSAPLGVVGCMRPDPSAQGWKLRVKALTEYSHRSEEIRLEVLSGAESTALVAGLDIDDVLAPRELSALVQRAEGNPLYLEELYQTVAGNGREAESTRPRSPSLPPALESLLLSRIDRLPSEARDLLQAAAVLGREFSKDVLCRMTPLEDVDDVLAVLLRADLIRERRREPAEYGFKHGLLQEAALSTLTPLRQRELHGRAASAIEQTYGPDLRDSVDALARHYLTSGDVLKGLEVLENFGERLTAIYRYDQAVQVLETCRSELPSNVHIDVFARVTQKLAELRARMGDGREAARLIDEIISRSRIESERDVLIALKGRLLVEAGNLPEAEEFLVESLERASDRDVEQRTLVLLSQVSLRRQDLPRARAFLDRLDDLEGLGEEVGFEAASSWAGYLAAAGDFVVARSWGERAVGLAAKIGTASMELRARRQLGVLELLNGRIRSAHSLLRSVYDLSTDLGFGIGALESGINVVHAAYLLGDLAEADDVSDQLLALGPPPLWEGLALSNHAGIKYELNDLAAARACAERVLSLGAELTSVVPRIASRVALSKVYLAESSWELAEEELRLAEEETSGVGGRQGLLLAVRTAAGELAWARGDWDRALLEAVRGMDDIQYAEKPTHVGILRLNGLALINTDRTKARALLDDAWNVSRVMELKLEEARTLIAIGLCSPSERPGRFAEADALFTASGCERGLVELAQARAESLRSYQ